MTRKCAIPWCRREAIRDGRECPDHLPRWTPRASVERVSPWVERVREGRGVAKVLA